MVFLISSLGKMKSWLLYFGTYDVFGYLLVREMQKFGTLGEGGGHRALASKAAITSMQHTHPSSR